MDRHSTRRLGWIVVALLAAVVLLPMVMMAFAVPMMGTMGWWWADGHMAGNSGVALLMGLVWLLVLVGGGYLVVRALGERVPSRDPALEELRAAYARGDLTDEEFERRREKLERD